MSSNIDLYEDENLSVSFELKARGVWLYAHNEDEPEQPSIHSRPLTLADLENMIGACEAVRDFIKRKDGIDG